MKILVMGDGLLGSEIVRQTSWNYISRKKDNFDFCDISTYYKNLDGYDVIVNCIANTDTYSQDKEKFYMINYKSVCVLNDHCIQTNKKLIHISTDYVYANSFRNATEEDLPLISPNWYTYYKLLSDEYIQLTNNNFLICRCSFKPRPFPYENVWMGQIGNFDYVDVIGGLIIKLINKNATGLINVGTEVKTMYSLAKQTRENIDGIIKPTDVPENISMGLTKLNNILK